MSVRTNKLSDSFFTPKWLIDEVLEFYDGTIDLDPCADSNIENRLPASNYYTFEDDGLELPWFGSVYCNPPYSNNKSTKLIYWVHKASACQACCQTKQTLLLLPANIDTKWGQMLLKKQWGTGQKDWILTLFFEGRISFLQSDYTPSNKNGRFASMMVYLGNNQERFKKQFKKFGVII